MINALKQIFKYCILVLGCLFLVLIVRDFRVNALEALNLRNLLLLGLTIAGKFYISNEKKKEI